MPLCSTVLLVADASIPGSDRPFGYIVGQCSVPSEPTLLLGGVAPAAYPQPAVISIAATTTATAAVLDLLLLLGRRCIRAIDGRHNQALLTASEEPGLLGGSFECLARLVGLLRRNAHALHLLFKGLRLPAECTGTSMETVTGVPDYRHVSTSYAERLGEELQANGEAIEQALGDLKHGRRAP
jgi:hypothetical protein